MTSGYLVNQRAVSSPYSVTCYSSVLTASPCCVWDFRVVSPLKDWYLRAVLAAEQLSAPPFAAAAERAVVAAVAAVAAVAGRVASEEWAAATGGQPYVRPFASASAVVAERVPAAEQLYALFSAASFAAAGFAAARSTVAFSGGPFSPLRTVTKVLPRSSIPT